MNNLFLLFMLMSLSLAGCKKVKENIEEKLAMDFITNGQWKVISFHQNGIDRTVAFNGYRFQFKNNKKVDAFKNGTLEITGTWDGSLPNRTIYASFPTTSNPLVLLNATWTIIGGSETSARATTIADYGEVRDMILEKNQ